jgi:hypothetical protein
MPAYRLAAVIVSALILVTALIVAPSRASAVFSGSTSNAQTFSAQTTFPDYSDSVIASGPLGYYRLDDAGGSTTAIDSSGNNNTGILVNSAAYWQRAAASPTRVTVTLPGNRQSSFASQSTINLASSSGAATFEIWFRTSSTTAGRLLSLNSSPSAVTGTTSDLVLTALGSGLVSFRAGGTTITSVSAYNDNAWHLAAGSVGPVGLKLAVDGAQVASATSPTIGTMTSGYVRAGGDTDWFTGSLDEAVVYPTQLSDTQVSTHYGGGTADTATWTSRVNADHPWALWHLDDAPVQPWGQDATDYPVLLADSSGSAHPATMRNLPPSMGTYRQAGALPGAGTSLRVDAGGWVYSHTARVVPNTFTYEMWFKTTTTNGGVLAVFSSVAGATCHNSDGTISCGRMLFMDNTGHLVFGIQPQTTLFAVTSTHALNDGQWHYLVATTTVGAGTTADLRLYIDNSLDATATVPKPNTFSGYFAFGGGGLPYTSNTVWPANASLSGWLDEVAFYDKSLSAETMSQHWYAKSRQT